MFNRLLNLPAYILTPQRKELQKIALLSTFLPVWQFEHFYSVSRDVEQVFTRSGSKVVPQKSGQKSTIISPALHNLWWMDSWEEPRFEPISLTGNDAPKTYHMDPFDDQGWFTGKQWSLIAPLLPSSLCNTTRGRPHASAHAVLSAIFFKIAIHCSWEHLGSRFPPARTCRRYYKRWLLSGRLLTIYKLLIEDLLKRGRVHPYDFVQEGYFQITEDFRIFTIPGLCPDTWQTRMALFLMQLSYTVLRRLRREEKDYYFPQKRILQELEDQYQQKFLSRS